MLSELQTMRRSHFMTAIMIFFLIRWLFSRKKKRILLMLLNKFDDKLSSLMVTFSTE